jgi:hypothetical protein
MHSLHSFEKSSESMFSRSGTKFFYFFVFLILFLFLFSLLPAAAAENDTVPVLLISNESTVLQMGGVYTFQQGYEVVIQSFRPGSILIEIFINNTTASAPHLISNATLEEGETVQCYRRTGNGTNIVFMMTLDKIYYSSSEMAAEFSHINQYNDTGADDYPLIPDWVIYTDTLSIPLPNDPNNTSDNKSNNESGKENDIRQELIVEPIYIISGIFLIAAAAVFLILLHKQKMKNKSKNNNKKSKNNNKKSKNKKNNTKSKND